MAAASLPDFDLSRYRSDYAALSADSTAPLLDRVCQGLYAPGSAFNPLWRPQLWQRASTLPLP